MLYNIKVNAKVICVSHKDLKGRYDNFFFKKGVPVGSVGTIVKVGDWVEVEFTSASKCTLPIIKYSFRPNGSVRWSYPGDGPTPAIVEPLIKENKINYC